MSYIKELSTEYLEGRVEILKYSIKITTTLNRQIVLEQELDSILEELESREIEEEFEANSLYCS
jgi:hypothetical protein